MVTNSAPSDGGMDLLFRALAHRARRRILDLLAARPGSRVCDLTPHFAMSRIAIMKHLGVLSEANLVVSRREGRERRLFLNAVPIQQVHERWITAYGALFAGGALELKRRVEAARTKERSDVPRR